jgi:hypothetical protein
MRYKAPMSEDGSHLIVPPGGEADLDHLVQFFEATREFAKITTEETHNELRGITDGKAVGTYIEHRFQAFLLERKLVRPEDIGSSAKGIDFPNLGIDIKVTSVKQPQSSCPFKSFKQKVEGLGYNLVLFVYDKRDTPTECYLPLVAVRFIPKERTADYTTTKRITEMIKDGGNAEDIFAYFVDKKIPADEPSLMEYAEWVLRHPPVIGYLTISNALQWRLQYARVIATAMAGVVNLDPPGVEKLPEIAGALVIGTEDNAEGD